MEDNLQFWKKMAEPPKSAQSPIKGKRYQGTDIKPQWRILALTEQFGPCGIGWSMEVVKAWREEGHEAGHSMAVVEVQLFIKHAGEWGKGISGVGGCILTKAGYSDDDAFKKATTDAFGKAAAMVGVGANIYMGNSNDSKYYEEAPESPTKKESKPPSQSSGKTKNFEFLKSMGVLKQQLIDIAGDEKGQEEYYRVLNSFKFQKADAITDRQDQTDVYHELIRIINESTPK